MSAALSPLHPVMWRTVRPDCEHNTNRWTQYCILEVQQEGGGGSTYSVWDDVESRSTFILFMACKFRFDDYVLLVLCAVLCTLVTELILTLCSL